MDLILIVSQKGGSPLAEYCFFRGETWWTPSNLHFYMENFDKFFNLRKLTHQEYLIKLYLKNRLKIV